MSNAERFIKAYNTLDYALRTQYNFKRGMPFSDCVRRSVVLNSVIRKYEDELIDYGRLRNAIIHSGKENDEIIAEPKLEVVEKLEHIVQVVTTPPRAYDTVCRKDVVCVDSKVSVKETIGLIGKTGYSNIPVYSDGELIGVANGQKIINIIGKTIEDKKDLDTFVEETKIGEIINQNDNNNFYTIQPISLTVSEALNLFYENRKLLVILITPHGNYLEMPIGIISVTDILDINKIIENY